MQDEINNEIENLVRRITELESRVQLLSMTNQDDSGQVNTSGDAYPIQMLMDDQGCFELSISGELGTFENPHYRVAGKTFTAPSTCFIEDGILCVVISATGSTPVAIYETYEDIIDLQAAEKDMSKFICPLYTILNNDVTCDWRKGAVVVMTEF